VVSGAIVLVIDGTERRLEAGDAAVIRQPSCMPHV
jgi:uncharacterized cupin superfamily protein